MTINQEPINEVLDKYNLKVLSVKNESYKDKKGVWWVETSLGLKVLKKVSCSEDTLKYILSAVNHLINNGVNIPEIVKTKDGDGYANINGTCFVLNNAVIGKNPNYSNDGELEKIVKGLAVFHKAGKGFFPDTDTKPKYHLGTWVEDYVRQIEDMNGFYKKELEGNSSQIGKMIMDQFPHFYEIAKKVIEDLNGQEYKDWVKKVEKEGCLCHQDFAAGNLILNNAGELFVLDTDSLTIDIPARDIRKLINKIMKKAGNWDTDLMKKIFRYYQSENPLSRDEWNVVKLDIMFPHLFIGAMNKYYYQRDKEWSQENYLKRIKEMSLTEKSKISVMDKFDYVIPT